MNKKIKSFIAASAVAVAVSASAVDAKPVYEDAVGWTPVAVSLASPVQLPWGIGNWDVFGLDLGFLYNDIAKMYGLQAGLANTCRDDLRGLAFSGLFNYADRDVYAIRAALGVNMCNGTLRGMDAGGLGWHRDIAGIDFELVGTVQENICGFGASLLANVTDQESYGCTIAGGVNLARTAYGCQLAGLYNQTEELHGCQIALVNYAKECPWGFQIGLVNIIMDNQLKVLPIVNGFF